MFARPARNAKSAKDAKDAKDAKSARDVERVTRAVVLAAAMLGAAACKRGASEAADAAASESASASASSSVPAPTAGAGAKDAAASSLAAALDVGAADAGTMRAPADAPRAGTMVDVPAGTYPSGSTPGDDGSDPTLEPALVDVALGAFSIDALPFPGDPAVPAKTGVSLEDAARLCRDRGARLCTELEWERACKGPDLDVFSTGARWNPACEKESARCASGFGVRAMGALAELTDSRFAAAEGSEGAPVLRGGTGAPSTRRCAARSKSGRGGEGASASETGFRCCKGPGHAARIAAVESRPAFKKAALEPAQLAKVFAQVPELARIGSDLRYFTEGDVRAMTGKTSAPREGLTFVTTPVLWSPEPGAELLVATGRGKTMSFVVALWTLPGERHRFASSFLMLNDLSPVALAFDPARRKELRWTSCWGCPGEQGTVSYRFEDHRVVIVQQ